MVDDFEDYEDIGSQEGPGQVELPHVLSSQMDLETLTRGIQENFDALGQNVGQLRQEQSLLSSDVEGLAGTIPSSGSDLDPDSFEAPPTDGVAPSASPDVDVVQAGPSFLSIKWDGVDNSDPVTYEVHMGTTSGFTPGVGTIVGETNGTLVFARMAGGVALSYDTDYWIRIIAKDADGAAAAGTADGPHRIARVDGAVDIVADSIGANQIAAGSITAEELAVIILTATKIFSPAQTGWRLEIGDDGTTVLRYWDGTEYKFYLDLNGNVFVSGEIKWGSGSQLTADMVELAEYGGTSSFQLPTVRQVAQAGSGPSTTFNMTGIPVTVTGNTLILVVASIPASGSTAPANTAVPAGWAAGTPNTNGKVLVQIFYKLDAAATTSTGTFTFDRSSYYKIAFLEASGIAPTSALDKQASADGTSSISTGTTATTTQTHELWVGGFATWVGGITVNPFNTPSNGFTLFMQTYNDPQDFGVGGIYKIVTTTGGAESTSTVNGSGPSPTSAGVMLTLKAATTGSPPSPAADKIRVFAKDMATKTALAMKDGDGKDSTVVGALSDTSPITGTNRGNRIVQAGSSVVTTNAGGTATITFPAAFPNSVISVVAVNGDAGVNSFNCDMLGVTLSQFQVYTGLLNFSLRINWFAVGT